MSQFIPGDIVASKSGTRYKVVFVAEGGRMGVSPTSGKGAFRNLNAANATMVTPAERPTRSALREAAIREAEAEVAARVPATAYEYVEAETVKTPRSEAKVEQAVRQLAKKLRGRNTWKGQPIELYAAHVTRGQGTIRVAFVQPVTGQPDHVLAAIEMDQDATAVELYRAGRIADGRALHNEIMFNLGHTDPAKHDMKAAWRVLVDLHADAGQPGRREDWADREILEWIERHHVDGREALKALETKEENKP